MRSATLDNPWQWSSQKAIEDGGRPDIVLSCGRPLLVVEVKVSAPIGDGQLRTYGNWLKREGHPQRALVLLTHTTDPPDDFVLDAYGVSLCNVCRWSEVYLWLKRHLSTAAPLGELSFSVVTQLANEFMAFLEEQNMAVPDIDVSTLADLENALEHETLAKLAELMTSVSARVTSKAIRMLPQVYDNNALYLNGWGSPKSLVSGSFYCFEKHLGWNVAWGFFTGSGMKRVGMETMVPKLQAFVYIGGDSRAFDLPPRGNRSPEERRLVARSIGKAISDPQISRC